MYVTRETLKEWSDTPPSISWTWNGEDQFCEMSIGVVGMGEDNINMNAEQRREHKWVIIAMKDPLPNYPY